MGQLLYIKYQYYHDNYDNTKLLFEIKGGTMRLSTQARYGTRAMLDLAVNYQKGCTTIKDVSNRQDVSARYLENLMMPLRASGLVRTERGKSGGYILGKDPSEITLGEVVRMLDGTFTIVPCIKDPKLCHRAPNCVTRRIWGRLQEAITHILDGLTLEDMINMQEELA